MNQPVIAFHIDEEGDWIAHLACGHARHMRHNPPWLNREWVLTEEGRQNFLGQVLNCTKCGEAETVLPPLSSSPL